MVDANGTPLARSRPKVGVGYLGEVPPAVWDILETCFLGGLAVSSNYARERSAEVALAASLGWIGTITLDGAAYGRVWFATFEGLNCLKLHLQPQKGNTPT